MLEYYDAQSRRMPSAVQFQEEGRTLASLSYPGIPQMNASSREDRFYLAME
jgi:hypothetical protein